MLKNLFVFDIETVPDIQAARNLLGDYDSKDEAIKDKLVEYHLNITDGKNDFIRHPFHKVVTISFLEAEIERNPDGTEYYRLKEIRSGGTPTSKESDLIAGLFSHLSKLNARLVSFNGRTFDLPVLKYRAMLHGVEAKWLHQAGDKWNSYNNRYSMDWHCDLIDAYSDYGASAKVKMSEVCALFGYPGKLDVDGSQVYDLYKKKKIQEIRDYCELDVVNTYLLYLRYMQHTGSLNKANYARCLQDLISYLENNSSERSHLSQFLDSWMENHTEESFA
jgi:predicted PolB exonuclease-like 3'-5' exonuclease